MKRKEKKLSPKALAKETTKEKRLSPGPRTTRLRKDAENGR